MTWVAVGVAGVSAGLAGTEYLWNKHEQKKDEAKRPVYNIPPEVQQGLTLADQQALQGLPEAQKQQYLTNLQRGTSYGLSQIGSRKGGLAGLGTLNEQQNQGYANLLSQDSAARMQNQKNVFGQLNNVAENKQQQFQLNQLNPFYENMARSQANRGALMQNLNKSVGLAAYGVGGKGQQQAAGGQSANGLYNDNSNLGNFQYSDVG